MPEDNLNVYLFIGSSYLQIGRSDLVRNGEDVPEATIYELHFVLGGGRLNFNKMYQNFNIMLQNRYLRVTGVNTVRKLCWKNCAHF